MSCKNRAELAGGAKGQFAGNLPFPSGQAEGQRQQPIYRLPLPLPFPRGNTMNGNKGNCPS